jgi:hypothetical protein
LWSNRACSPPCRPGTGRGWRRSGRSQGLIVEGPGATRKLTSDVRTLLDKFGKPIPGDDEARPLLISEGSARDKLRAIEGNDYLAHAYETFSDSRG